MGVLARWRARRRDAGREQIWSAAAADEAPQTAPSARAEQAERTQQLAAIAVRLHRIAAGTILYLRAGEWRRCNLFLPPAAYVDVRVTALGDQVMVDPDRPDVWWVGVTGHLPECARGDDGHSPCISLHAHAFGIVRSVCHGAAPW